MPRCLRSRLTARRRFRAFERALRHAETYGGAHELLAAHRRT